jgi:tetratricopeptide (TPR) repeat protein
MRRMHWVVVALLASSSVQAKEGGPHTVQEAIADAELALDTGRVGDAVDESERLQRTRHLTKDEVARVEVIVGRCKLFLGEFEQSAKLLAKRHKAAPEDTRLAEWYARALDGAGKSDEALTLLTPLAKDGKLQEGDSYWTLAQLERKKGDDVAALEHAELALHKPIVQQSDELDHAIHQFIDELTPRSKGK